MARPNRKGYALLFAAFVLFLIGANIQAGWLYVLGATIAGTVVAGALVPTLSVRRISVQRILPRLGRVGDDLRFGIVVTNSSSGGIANLFLEDRFVEARTLFINRLGPESSRSIEYSVTPVRRGVFESSEIEAWTGFPFGLSKSKKKLATKDAITVHPTWVRLASFPLLEASSSPNEPMHDRRRKGAGLDFFGIREYRSGDSLRHVHWRSSARGGRLLVKEYEEQIASRMGIWIDSSDLAGNEPYTSFETAVSSAASLLIYGLETGHPVQLFCDSKLGTDHLFEPSKAEALDWLSHLEAGGRRGLSRLVNDFMGEIQPRTTNVLIFCTSRRASEDIPQAIARLQGLGTRVVAIAISAASFGAGMREALSSDEEGRFLSELGAARALVYRVDSQRDLLSSFQEPFIA